MRLFTTLTLFCFTLAATAQVTLQITSLPSNTPSGADIYFAGSSNNWNAGDVNAEFAVGANQIRSYTFTPPIGTVEFKITRGTWATVEGTSTGAYIPNRTFSYTGTPKTVQITVSGWKIWARQAQAQIAQLHPMLLSSTIHSRFHSSIARDVFGFTCHPITTHQPKRIRYVPIRWPKHF